MAADAVRRGELREPGGCELAGRFARQGLDRDDPARQEGGVDAAAQRRQDPLAAEAGGDDERHQAGDAGGVGGIRRAPERAVDHALDRVEMEIQMAERAALAGDVDQVVGAAEQAEAIRSQHLEHVGQRRRLGHVATAHPRVIVVAVERQAGEGVPLGAGRGAPGRHLAGLGAAVDLDQRRGEGRLGACRELRRQRRGGAEDQLDLRHGQAGIEQGLEMERRRHQPPRRRRGGERSDDIGRIEGPARVERRAAVQGEQHARLEAEHVLRRHGRDQGEAGERLAAGRFGQARRFGAGAGGEQAPGLGMRHRLAGRSRGEHVGGDAIGVQTRVGQWDRARHRRGSVDDARQAVAFALGFDQRIGTGEARAQPLDRVRRVVRRQQAGVAAQQRRAEADGEAVAIGREIEHRPARRQPLGQRGRVGEVLTPADRDAVAARDRRFERAGAEQGFARHGARSGAAWRRE